MKNGKPFMLALIAGLIFIHISWVGSIGIFQYLTNLTTLFPELAPLEGVINIVLYVLAFIAALGGIGVIIGGVLLTRDRVRTGKFVIGLAAGMSLIGIIINMITSIWLGGLTGVYNMFLLEASLTGWVGIILSILARRKAE